MADPGHPWWQHLPPAERSRRQTQHRRQRWLTWLLRPRQRLLFTLLVYGLLCASPLLIGQPHLSLMALLPLILVPPVAYLMYVMAWHEFHR
jgi:hypothetical protein